jgi:hypothetical protein
MLNMLATIYQTASRMLSHPVGRGDGAGAWSRQTANACGAGKTEVGI